MTDALKLAEEALEMHRRHLAHHHVTYYGPEFEPERQEQTAARMYVSSDKPEAALTALRSARAELGWRPIAEAHEDYGQCVFINMEDADTPVCASTLDTDFTENCEWYGWTHFTPITLTTETAERLKAAIPAPPKEASDE